MDQNPLQSAMVLAAGLGLRMRPLTEQRPKPLVDVAGKPLIDWTLERLEAAGVARVVVNVHYRADQMEDHLARWAGRFDLKVSDERDVLLETGGGVVRALPKLLGPAFLALNSDNLWLDGPVNTLHSLQAGWEDAAMDALLLLVPTEKAQGYDGAGDFFLEADGRLTRRGAAATAPYVFAGVQIIARAALAGAPEGPFSLNWLFDHALASGRLYGLVHQGPWFHVGAPAAVDMAQARLMAL